MTVRLAFPHSRYVAPEATDAFFKDVDSSEYLLSSDPHGATMTALVKVDKDMIDEYPLWDNDPVKPEGGYYIIYWADEGTVVVFFYGDDLEAATEDYRDYNQI